MSSGEQEALQREVDNLRARLDRAITAAEEHFGEDAIRYKLSLFKNGRASNYFPQEFDGKWFAFQRADNDAHVGLCDRINQLVAEREADLAAMREALEALEESVDLVRSDYMQDWRHGLPTRKAQLDGMKEQVEAHEAAISSLKARTQ